MLTQSFTQLRKCHRQLENVNTGTNVNNNATKEFADSVDELWVLISVAEKTAKRIGWGDAEQKDLKLAQNLLSHIDDATYSDEVRTNLFTQLKQVVDRLNTKEDLVPAQVVAQIETRSRKEIEESAS